MDLLREFGFEAVNHYVPLHYLPFIARSGQLLAKPELRACGFLESHFRSKSARHDQTRGFGGYVHLTTHPRPPILQAKLAGGFPHIRLQIPTEHLEVEAFDLCRFNVAMTRQLRRGGKRGHKESDLNGRYYGTLEVPIARVATDQRAMLALARETGAMLEVLVPSSLPLPSVTQIHCYSEDDTEQAKTIVRVLDRSWPVFQDTDTYRADPKHATAVREFVAASLRDPDWKGNGLEFDRV